MATTIIFFFSSREMPTKEDYDINVSLSFSQAKKKEKVTTCCHCFLRETKLEKKTIDDGHGHCLLYSKQRKKHKKGDIFFTTTHYHLLHPLKHRKENDNIVVIAFFIAKQPKT
jgi:hypothetical protein